MSAPESLFEALRYRWRRQFVRHPLTGQRLWRIRLSIRIAELRGPVDRG